MSAGDFAHVRVDQYETDVALRLNGPQDQAIAERDAPETKIDPEPLSWVAGEAGAYVIAVRSLEPEKTTGRYRISFKERRPATAADRRREAAERAFAEGDALYKPDTLPQAIAKYREALALFHELALPEWEAHAAMRLAWVHLFREEIDDAFNLLSVALPIWESLADDLRQAMTLNVMAVARLREGDAQQSLGLSLEALGHAERAADARAQVSALSNLSSAYWMLGDRPAENAYQDRAIVLARTLDDEQLLAGMLHGRGVSRQTVGESLDALVDLREALRIRTKLKLEREQAGSLNAIAEIYRELDRLSEALDYHSQALALRRATGDRAGISQSLNNLGLAYRSQRDFAKARTAFEESLQIRRDIQNRSGQANVLVNLAALDYGDFKEYERALGLLGEALALNEALGNLPGQASVLRHMGRVHVLQNHDEAALAASTRALDLARQVRNPVIEVESLKQLATLAARRSDLKAAVTHLEAAMDVVESGRRLLFGDTLRAAFLATNTDLQADYVDALMRLHEQHPADGNDLRALQAVERFRARSLLDLLQEAKVNLSDKVAPELVQQERELHRRLDAIARRAFPTGPSSEYERAKAESEMTGLITEYRELTARVNAANPRIAELSDAALLSIHDIQTHVTDDQTVLLEYSLGSERSYLWVVTPTRTRTFVLAGEETIGPLARHVHQLLTSRNQHPSGETIERWRARLASDEAELARALVSLGRLVLEPAAEFLPGKRLLVVPSGALQYVPFAALPSPGQTTPLVVTNEVVSAPSASVLAALRRRRFGRPRPAQRVAVLADPVFDAGDPRLAPANGAAGGVAARPLFHDANRSDTEWQWAAQLARAVSDDGRLPRLRYSRDEAKVIIALTRPNERLIALDFEASRTTAMSDRLRDYRIVHLASHGFVNSAHPELSGLAFSMVDVRGKAVDGFLRLHQIYGLDLPVDLVVLSACQTGIGEEIKGEGLMSLTRGFMHAGASAVAASLWKVDDQATAELMKRFYQGILGNDHAAPSAALRAAQIAMLKQPRWSSPYYWAAFVFQGDWRLPRAPE
jgi:CHAT domain-containing protein/tetratricopeptide (TPR) repeat protein